MGVASPADTAFQVNAGALLHDVGRLVCSGVQIRRTCERHVVAGGECLRSHRIGTFGGGPIGVRLDAADVMVSEGALDLLGVRQLC